MVTVAAAPYTVRKHNVSTHKPRLGTVARILFSTRACLRFVRLVTLAPVHGISRTAGPNAAETFDVTLQVYVERHNINVQKRSVTRNNGEIGRERTRTVNVITRFIKPYPRTVW